MAKRSGGSVERRKLQKNEECGFLPKAATLVLQRSHYRIADYFCAAETRARRSLKFFRPVSQLNCCFNPAKSIEAR